MRLMVLGFMGISAVGICGGTGGVQKEIIAQKRGTREIVSPATAINKVIIGVLDVETSSPADGYLEEKKKAVMRELKRNTRVKLVDIRESCSLSDLKRNGYERAVQYKMSYQLDMILHTLMSGQYTYHQIYFSLVDLYSKKVKEVSIDIQRLPIELGIRGFSGKLLASQDINRVLRERKKSLGIKGGVKKSLGEKEKFLIQNGPKLIAQGEHDFVLDLIEDLPPRSRWRNAQIQTVECFANLKGWVRGKDTTCKLSWWKLRQKLIDSGDNEATPTLVIFLKDEDSYLRYYAAELLGYIGDTRALEDLRTAGKNDENFRVRKYSKWAYEEISGEKF